MILQFFLEKLKFAQRLVLMAVVTYDKFKYLKLKLLFLTQQDYLCKITDYCWVLDEIEDFVSPSAEFASLLLQHGLNVIDEL